MKTYTKCVCSGVCLLATYPVLVWGLGLMNQPSDRALYTGLAAVLGLFALVPGILWSIWRRT
jgi:hypothetical protein